jgi:hypothetical protein
MARESSEASSLFMHEYIGRYLEDVLREEGEKRAKELGNRDRIVRDYTIPIYPKSLWLEARLNYVLQNNIAAIALCTASLEAALKIFLGRYFKRKLGVDLDKALDEMEIRSLIAMSKALGLLDELTEKSIRKIGDIRQEFVHSKIVRISEKIEKKIVSSGEVTPEELRSFGEFRWMSISEMAGENEAKAALELLEQVYKALFDTSDYWKW